MLGEGCPLTPVRQGGQPEHTQTPVGGEFIPVMTGEDDGGGRRQSEQDLFHFPGSLTLFLVIAGTD